MSLFILPKIFFKTDRQQKEWESGEIPLKIINIMLLLQQYITLEFPDYLEITVTEVFRKQEEQDQIYLNHTDKRIAKSYKEKPWNSVHQFWRAVDIRSVDMPKKMPEKITEFLNFISYDPKRPSKKTALYHDVGTGKHIHIQVLE